MEQVLIPFEAPGLITYTPPSAAPADVGVTRFAYDALGRLIQQTQPDGKSRTWTYSGFTTDLTDEAGNRRTSVGDAYGRVVREELYQGPTTLLTRRAYTYDGLGGF